MALRVDITAADEVIFDTDRILVFTVYTADTTDDEAAAGTGTPLDVAGQTLGWFVRTKTGAADPPLIYKTTAGIDPAITITGVFNSDPAQNTQRVQVTLKDTDTYDPAASPVWRLKPKTYVHALKRLDAESEDVYAYGDFVLIETAAWEAP